MAKSRTALVEGSVGGARGTSLGRYNYLGLCIAISSRSGNLTGILLQGSRGRGGGEEKGEKRLGWIL